MVPVVPLSDSAAYDMFARNLARGVGYKFHNGRPTAFWPVGTAFVYSLVYRAFGESYVPIVALNLILGVAVVGLSMVLARRYFGSRAALFAGLILSFWPLLVEYSTILASELPFLVSMLAAWLVWTDARCGLAGRSALAGVALAAASYFRPTALLLPLVLAIPELRNREQRRLQVVQIILVGLVMSACFAPWIVRNYRVFGEFVLISTNGGANSWLGNRPGASGFYEGAVPNLPVMSEVEFDRLLAAEASAYIRDHPGAFVTRSLTKLIRLHERESIGVVWNQYGLERVFRPSVILAIKLASNVYWWAVLALAALGIALLSRTNGFWWTLCHPATLVWGYFAVVHAVTLIQDRHHMPCIPSIAAFAALALDRLCCRCEPAQQNSSATAALFMALGFVLR
jgi:4-amino-4-deoxy-L-arabinose transferase-like glycosyltransferase